MSRQVAPPSGMPPPEIVTTPHGRDLDLAALAREACVAYGSEFPDERERYGLAGAEWCRHDCQHLVNWAVLSLTVGLDYGGQLAWLARVLEARSFPLERLARCLELLAEVVRDSLSDEPEIAGRLQSGAAFVASRPTFLD
ncbi:MAG TPA: hypothetical protein VGF91_18435 [Solirubrobacteraceae bacterium]